MSRRWRRAVKVSLGLVGGLLLLVGAVYLIPSQWLVDRLARWFPGCLYQVQTRRPLVALTIDDGPDSSSTPRILDQLRRHDARATFFLITDRMEGQRQLIRRVLREGHELGNHFTQDRPSILLGRHTFEADLLQAHLLLSTWTYPRWARPGSGWYSQDMLSVMRRHGYRCALGSVYPLDTAIPSVTWATSYILRHTRPGAVLMLHDGESRGRRTAQVLERVLPELRRRGYRVVTLSGLVGPR
jgi:peptidoglycan/xylan/chitin deacetylase (PgdA/CDA1 family)